MLCQFLLYSKVTQSFIHTHTHTHTSFLILSSSVQQTICLLTTVPLSVLLQSRKPACLCPIYFLGKSQKPDLYPQTSRAHFFFFFGLFRAAPMAYESSQSRPMPQPQQYRIRATSQPTSSSWQHWILNPLSRARDPTHVLMDTTQVCYC